MTAALTLTIGTERSPRLTRLLQWSREPKPQIEEAMAAMTLMAKLLELSEAGRLFVFPDVPSSRGEGRLYMDISEEAAEIAATVLGGC